MKIVAGLGNPGARYEATRHNVGFMVLDLLADKLSTPVATKSGFSFTGRAFVGGERVILAKPQCFMNRSGVAIAALVEYFKIEPEDLVVIHDDLDLEQGSIRIRVQGGDGGHKGVRSVIDALDTGGFCRLKVGIGRPPSDLDPADYVLQPFSAPEWESMRLSLLRASEAAAAVLTHGAQEAMNDYNRSATGGEE